MSRESGVSGLKQKNLIRKVEKMGKRHGWSNALLDQLNDELKWNLCNARLALGELDWWGWGLRVKRDGIIPTDFPNWHGQAVNNLLVLGEQGLGDEIMWCNLLKDLPAKHITFDCQPRLESIFQRCFPDIEVMGRIDLRDNSFAKGRNWDAQVLLGDLPARYRRKRADFPKLPYLWPKEDVGTTDKVGVSWRGRQGGYHPSYFKAMGGTTSLQYQEASDIFEQPDIDLNDDMEAVFSLIYSMKKVISVPTTVAHIAGSMGVPCDVILPPKSTYLNSDHGGFDRSVHNGLNWRWFPEHNGGDTMLWHPSITIYPNMKQYMYSQK